MRLADHVFDPVTVYKAIQDRADRDPLNVIILRILAEILRLF
jgi:hypothetical protein